MARWLEKLQTYDFRIKYIAGKGHQNADVLSWHPYFEANCTHCQHQREKELPGDSKGSRPAYTLPVVRELHWERRIEGRGTVRKPTVDTITIAYLSDGRQINFPQREEEGFWPPPRMACYCPP